MKKSNAWLSPKLMLDTIAYRKFLPSLLAWIGHGKVLR